VQTHFKPNQDVASLITNFTVHQSQYVVDMWWGFLDFLFTKYRDGVRLMSFSPPLWAQGLFYPSWWLGRVGFYDDGPLVMTSVNFPPPLPPHPLATLDQIADKPRHATPRHGNNSSRDNGSPSALAESPRMRRHPALSFFRSSLSYFMAEEGLDQPADVGPFHTNKPSKPSKPSKPMHTVDYQPVSSSPQSISASPTAAISSSEIILSPLSSTWSWLVCTVSMAVISLALGFYGGMRYQKRSSYVPLTLLDHDQNY